MSKDVYWFSHDSNASRDIKMMQLKHQYDFWGIGLYWSVIEVLREQPNYRFDSTESGLSLLSTLVMCSDMIRFENWFNDCVRIGLFKTDKNTFFSESLCERMKNWESKKANGSKGGRPQKTESKTEIKPKVKPNQNHKRIEEKRREENSTNTKNDINDRKKAFADSMASFKETYPSQMLRDFYEYWTEHSENGKKMRFEKETVFELARRLRTWQSRDKTSQATPPTVFKIDTNRGK